MSLTQRPKKTLDKGAEKPSHAQRDRSKSISKQSNVIMGARKLKKTTVVITLGGGVQHSRLVRPHLKELSSVQIRKPAPISELSEKSEFVKVVLSGIPKCATGSAKCGIR